MTSRQQSFVQWSGVVALVGLCFTVASLLFGLGRRDAAIDAKLDRAEFERVVGEMRGDIRVIRATVCAQWPERCR